MALSDIEPPHENMALSKVGPPQVPLRGACSSMCPVQVHCLLRLHLLYWNTTRDQSEGLFRGLSWNPYLPEGSKAGPPQSECIACFACTFSIETPHATSPRGCFEGLVRTLNTWPCPKLDLPSPKCIACFAHTFSIGTPHATSPRGCFKGLV